jgi:hemolysin activation/secretion protein
MAGIGVSLMLVSTSWAQALPGPADAGRIRPEEKIVAPDHSQDQKVTVPANPPSVPIPKAAKGINFVLKAVSIEGATAFTAEQLADIYTPYLDKEVTLDVAWMIAGAITERYRSEGYLLSRSFVPQQRIRDGRITIRVIEGYVGEIDLDGSLAQHSVIRTWSERLMAQKPVTGDAVESFLLRLNDLPGFSFRGVLSPLEDRGPDEPAVKLTLVPTPKVGRGSVSFDNYSSRYLGPNELSASYSASLLPLHQTTLSGLSSLLADKLHYGTLGHTVVIAPGLTLELNAGVTKAYPGYTLKPLEIDSIATSGAVSLHYQWIRRRQENLALKLTLETRNVTSDILHTALTRDYIRALRVGATYDRSDRWQGSNVANFSVSRGIDGLGSSHKGDLNLSRAGARPDFTKAELSLSRLQAITGDWSLLAATSAQFASGVLFSSEQFGYGGQAFGRAYDASDITGDKGISFSLELRYGGWAGQQPVSLQPYAFYDIGEVWNVAAGQPQRESGASAGLGMRIATHWQQTGNLGLAWPLTRDIATPIYHQGERGPRILLQLGQEF